MISQRSTHYWLWTLLFGVIYGLATSFNSEAAVVTATGALGLITGVGALAARFARIYDLIAGVIFTTLGLLGILTSFPIGNQIGISASGMILGLSLGIPFSLIHMVLGLTSLNQGFKPAPVTPAVTVATPRPAA